MKYRLMRAILEQQHSLVVGIGALVVVAVLLLMGAGRLRLARLRATWVRLAWECGTPRPTIVRTVVIGHVAYAGLALICLIGGVATTDAKGGGTPFVAALATLAVLYTIDAAHTAWVTRRAIDAGPIEGDAHA